LIGLSAIVFGRLGMPAIEAPLWTQVVKFKQMSTLGFDLFSVYTGQLNFGQIVWDKTQVLLGTSSGTHLGTVWEHAENTLRIRERHKK
jgi:hypothetical protein